MKRQIKQLFMLSAFAGACMAVGMGLSYGWVAQAQEQPPVTVDAKGAEHLPPIADVAEKLNPTVVAITNTSFVKARSRGEGENPMGDDFFNWFFGPQRPGRSQPDEQRVQAGGSGVVISPDGDILTNNHVIDGIRGGDVQLEVKMADGRTFKATVLGKDKELDIALIHIDAKRLPYAKLGDSDALRIGEWVVAIGNPLGLEHTVTQGIISAKGRNLGPGTGLESFLQTDAAINRGNSGGPLLNLKGEVIGINTAIRPDGQNIGFAVPVNMVKKILGDLRTGKPVSRGYLGVGTRPMDNEFAESLGIKEGAVVSNVDRGTPADKAGIRRLDVITAVDGQKIRSGEDLVAAIAGRRAGETVTVTVWRDAKFQDYKVTLGDRKELQKGEGQDGDDEESAPAPDAEGSKSLNLEKSYGFTVEALTPSNRHMFGVPNDVKGVVVTSVAPRSGAAEKGLQPGLLVTAVGPRDVEGLAEFNQEVKKAGGKKPLLLLVRPPRGTAVTMAIPPR